MSFDHNPPPPPVGGRSNASTPTASPQPSIGGSRAHWGLALRLARREVRRHPWRHGLVTMMIMVPVLAAMAAFTAQRTAEQGQVATDRYQHGGRIATITISIDPSFEAGPAQIGEPDPAVPVTPEPESQTPNNRVEAISRLAAEASNGTAAVEAVWEGADWLTTEDMQPDGKGPRLVGAEIYEAPEKSRWSRRWVAEEGHLPRSGEEIFLTRDVAAAGDWNIGDTLTSGWTGQSFTVTGIGVAGDDVKKLAAVVGHLPDAYWTERPSMARVLVSRDRLASGVHRWSDPDVSFNSIDATSRQMIGVWAPDSYRDAVIEAMSRVKYTPHNGSGEFSLFDEGYVDIHSGSASWLETSSIASVFITVFMAGFAAVVAVVASAAFAIASRRQLKSVGLLSSAGADPKTIRSALVLQGAIPGLVAGLGALALAQVTIAVLNSQSATERVSDVYGISVTMPAGRTLVAMTIGVLAGMVAAWQPARAASRVPVLSALAGRRPLGPVPTRIPLTGAVVAGAGTLALVILTRMISEGLGGALASLWVLGAVLAVVFGCIALAPTLVAVTGRMADRFGGLTRLGLRSIARHRTQGAATVAALAVCLAIPVGVLTARTEVIRTSGRHLSVQSGEVVVEGGQAVEPPSLDEPSVAATTGPNGSVTTTGLLANSDSLVVQINGDLNTAESASAAGLVQEVAGPMTPISIYGLADGAGGWYAVAAIDPAQADGLLVPWAIERLRAGQAVTLFGQPGPVTLGEGSAAVTIDSVQGPGGGSTDLGYGLEADHLVPSSVIDRVAPGLTPLSTVLARNTPATATEQGLLDGMSADSGEVVPTLAELESARAAGGAEATPGVGPIGAAVPTQAWTQVINGYSQTSYEPGAIPDDSSNDDDWQNRWLLILAGATGIVALCVLAITLSLRAVDSADDNRAALAAGAPPARMRRQSAFEGVVLSLLGALLALPLGWLPVTAVLVGLKRDGWVDAGWGEFLSSRLVPPGWEIIPILLLPAVTAGVLWTVVPALRAALNRAPRDQVLPRT